MTYDEWWEPWDDPGGPDPERPDSTEEWTWDEESIAMGEYVGFSTYLNLRDRLQTLRIPTTLHNGLIQVLIDTHDDSAISGFGAMSTLFYAQTAVSGKVLDVIEILDGSKFGRLDEL